jgi:hypothetical protein
MPVQLPIILAAIALLAALGCGSTSDLVIGYQAEASAPLRPPMCLNPVRDAAEDFADASIETGLEPDDAAAETSADADLDGADSSCPLPGGPCGPLKVALIHRYSFNGTGAVVTDSVGTANGTVFGTRLNGDGTLVLAGGNSDQFVDLPDGIVRSLHDATFEAWVEWNGCGTWQRIFDFGSSDVAEGSRGMAVTSLYVTPQSAIVADPAESNVMLGAFKRANQLSMVETRATAPQSLPTGVMSQVVLVVDDTNDVMSLYRDGVLEGSKPFFDTLSLLNDINNWLGRSQYVIDPSFNGTFFEFRIFNAPLSARAVRTLFLGGTDPAFLN